MDHILLVDGSDMDIVSFDDSEQFEEEDSVCSWITDTDQALNWSGWKQSCPSLELSGDSTINNKVLSLIELSARCVARNFAFEVIESYKPPIPEGLQLRIAFWSFPENEDEIRLYSCLAFGSNEKFKLGDNLAKSGNVKDVLQIGFHLSGIVMQPVSHTPVKKVCDVAISFDRGHITSCQCSCQENTTWCEHATAVCLYRIFHRNEISLRAPVSESLTRLERDQLQKFAQYLISELPQQILPTAQRILDELLSSKNSTINVVDGAPDPTAGASASEEAKWILDEVALRENIKKILGRFCGVVPPVYVGFSSAFLTSAPPVSLEWSNVIRSYQSREPEAIWNLLSIVRHMFARGDKNATNLLQFITEECLLCYQMMFYWVSSYINFQGSNNSRMRPENIHSSLQATNDVSCHTSCHLMEEVVHLWELAAMTPYLDQDIKKNLERKCHTWSVQVIEAAKKGRGQVNMTTTEARSLQEFCGFGTALQACEINWDIYYGHMMISKGIIREITGKGRASKLEIPGDEIMEGVYNKILVAIPHSLDEFQLVNKLTQALCCHGFVGKASKLAAILAKKTIRSYPEKMNMGEINFASITDRANNLCDMMMKSEANEKIAFEMAILGLTVPRLPAQSNTEELHLSFLEMELYTKLKSIVITCERLAFIRYQAHKLLANPMLRGDAVLPLIMATFIFEVLCGENVTSSVLRSRDVYYALKYEKNKEDAELGYSCALVSLGLCSSALDPKELMLCESIRHHRRDLALALLTYCRTEQEKIEQVLAVILDRNRYAFMGSNQTGRKSGVWVNTPDPKKTTKKGGTEKQIKPVNKAGFTRSDAPERRLPDNNNGFKFGNTPETRSPERHPPPKLSSDSDSGHGEGGGKRFGARNLPVSTNRKTQQQRRHTRQTVTKTRNEKSQRPWVKPNDRPWLKPKTTRMRRTSKSKTTREMTESDSGQEMHFPFEGDSAWPAQTENWEDEMTTADVHQTTLLPFSTTTTGIHEKNENTSGEGSSLSSLGESIGGIVIEGNITSPNNPSHFPQPDLMHPLLLPSTLTSPVVLDSQEGALASPVILRGSRESIEDAGFEEDFCAMPDIFQSGMPDLHAGVSVDIQAHGDDAVQRTEDEQCSASILITPPSRMLYATHSPGTNTERVCLSSDQVTAIEDFRSEDESSITCPTRNSVHVPSQDRVAELPDEKARNIERQKEQIPDIVFDEKPRFLNGTQQQSSCESLANDPSSFSNSSSIECLTDQANSIDDASTSPSPGHADEETLAVNHSTVNQPIDNQDPFISIERPEPVVHRSAKKSPIKKSVKHIFDLDDLHAALQCESVPPPQLISSSNNSQQITIVSSAQVSLADHANRTLSHINNHIEPPAKDSNQVSAENKSKRSKKNKQKKNKKTKAKLTMNIQSIEAEAYSLFELAKSVLLQARNTAIFSADADEVNMNICMNRRLQLAAFEIGLFALNMHNYSSPNWFSRTYSSYVSWIENQSIDIGTPALRVLNDKWEGILTPSESIQIATRAFRTGDSCLKRTAAELALSCLCYSQSLGPGDITQTITMCREQNHDMLERACSAVENAGRNGGVQPELFFRIAREWHYLHEQTRQTENNDNNDNNQSVRSRSNARPNGTLNNRRDVNPSSSSRRESEMPVFMTPEQFVQEQMHQQAQEMLGRQIPLNTGPDQFAWIYPPYYGALHHCPLPQQAMHSRRIQNIDSYAPPLSNFPDELNLTDVPRYLQNAYRVGMRALEALTLRMLDNRPDIKYAIAPPSSGDIRWMCALAASLGPPYLKNFCKVVYNAVTSPYLLHDLALEAARHFASFNPAQLASYLRSPSVSPIVQKALAMYTELIHHDLVLLGPPGYADFVELLRCTRSAFCMAPGGMARFNEILEVVRKTYAKKRELWQLIMNGLSKA